MALNREVCIEKLLIDYKDELQALSDDELALHIEQQRQLRNLSTEQWQELYIQHANHLR